MYILYASSTHINSILTFIVCQ